MPLMSGRKSIFATGQVGVVNSMPIKRGGVSFVLPLPHSSGHLHLHNNAKRWPDPTRTTLLRRKFAADLTKRFRALKGAINASLITNNALGLGKTSPHNLPRLLTLAAMPPGAFEFATDAEKMVGFQTWLQDEVDRGILEVVPGPGREYTRYSGYMDTYIDSAYKRGMQRSETQLAKRGIDPSALSPSPMTGIDAMFNLPIHADSVAALYTRTFHELKGITDVMDQQISRSLAESLAEGRGLHQTARLLNNRVDAIGIHRARLLARTETIRAHHVGTMNSYREAVKAGVPIKKVEVITAGDDRTCEECEDVAWDGPYTLDQAQGLLPVHPQCRCTTIPIFEGEVFERVYED